MITQTLTQVWRSGGSQQYHCEMCGAYRVMTLKEDDKLLKLDLHLRPYIDDDKDGEDIAYKRELARQFAEKELDCDDA
jgi:hypothetical protein